MDFIAKYGSSPVDREDVPATRRERQATSTSRSTAPTRCCYVFKTMSEAQFGELSFFRVYSGTVKFGSELYNTDRATSPRRSARFIMLNGKTRDHRATHLSAGDIGAVVKLKDTHTGNTLCTPEASGHAAEGRISRSRTSTPRSSARPRARRTRSPTGLAALHHEDPTFLCHVDSRIAPDDHLRRRANCICEVIADRLRRRFNVHVEHGRAARAVIAKRSRARAIRSIATRNRPAAPGQFAEVWMRIEPKPRDTGVEFTQSLVGQNVDRVFVPSVEKGVKQRLHGRHPRRLPRRGREDRFLRRQDAPGGLEGHRVPDRRLLRVQGSFHRRAPVPARTDQHDRDPHPRGLHGQGDGRSLQPARKNSRHGRRRQLPGHQGARARPRNSTATPARCAH